MPGITITGEIERNKLELAAGTHTPTKGMVAMAKRGIAQMKESGHDVPPEAVAAGRKIAAGQQLNDGHVTAMAEYHAAHEYDCSVDNSVAGTQDMLWGGAPGAAWSAARAGALDVTSLSEDPLELGADDDLTLEIFVRDGLGEPIELADGDGIIWAPILRSGTLATRPGPYGEKLREPLVIVPGRSSDTHKEIGLENLLTNFKAGAVQHVTIPTTHDNGVLDNTGFIVDMKIVDSTTRPGERVLMGAHKITEPEVQGKLQRGTVANRSCGILHDYVDTVSGQQFDQVVEHVALTNKPWVRGMAAYGDLSELDFSERCVVPMTLSEGPVTNLADSVSDGSWDGSAGNFTDQQYERSCLVDRGGTKPAKERCSLPVREPDGTLNRNAVHSAAGRISALGDVTTEQKRAAAKKLIALYRGPLKEQPPINLVKLAAVSTKMSEGERKRELLADVQWGAGEPSLNDIRDQIAAQLSEFRSMGEPGGPPYYYVMDITSNKALVNIEYGDPDGVDDAWVVPFNCSDDGKVTLAVFAEWTPVQKEWVTDEDAAQDRDELGAILGPQGLPIPTALFSERTNNQQGGAQMPTVQESLERLELSDDQRAVFQRIADDNARLATQLAEATAGQRKESVANRVRDLQAKGFTPGFCAAYETIALADDGSPAAVLNLSENGGVPKPVEQTATQLADRLIEALLLDDPETGKNSLAGQGNLLTSPITARPPETTPNAENEEPLVGEAAGDALLSKWAKDDPTLTTKLEADFGKKPTTAPAK